MRTRYLLGILAVVVLLLAVWLVPLALASASVTPGPAQSPGAAHGSAGQCPFLQAHPWLDPHGSGPTSPGAGGSSGTGQDIVYL